MWLQEFFPEFLKLTKWVLFDDLCSLNTLIVKIVTINVAVGDNTFIITFFEIQADKMKLIYNFLAYCSNRIFSVLCFCSCLVNCYGTML